MQGLVSKIKNNVAIKINNLVFKYIEDDVVLSVNIKSAEAYSTGPDWLRAFADVANPPFLLHKEINVQDLTVCLDRKNDAGKIMTYQEPLLYRCSFKFRLRFSFASIAALLPSVAQFHLLCEDLPFNCSDGQAAMIAFLVERWTLLLAAKNDADVELESDPDGDGNPETSGGATLRTPRLPPAMLPSNPVAAAKQHRRSKSLDSALIFQEDAARSDQDGRSDDELSVDTDEEDESSWSSWAWNLVVGEDEDGGNTTASTSSTVVNFGIYVNTLSVTLKKTTTQVDSAFFGAQKRASFDAFARCTFHGTVMELWSSSFSGLKISLGTQLIVCDDCAHIGSVQGVSSGAAGQPHPHVSAADEAEKGDSAPFVQIGHVDDPRAEHRNGSLFAPINRASVVPRQPPDHRRVIPGDPERGSEGLQAVPRDAGAPATCTTNTNSVLLASSLSSPQATDAAAADMPTTAPTATPAAPGTMQPNTAPAKSPGQQAQDVLGQSLSGQDRFGALLLTVVLPYATEQAKPVPSSPAKEGSQGSAKAARSSGFDAKEMNVKVGPVCAILWKSVIDECVQFGTVATQGVSAADAFQTDTSAGSTTHSSGRTAKGKGQYASTKSAVPFRMTDEQAEDEMGATCLRRGRGSALDLVGMADDSNGGWASDEHGKESLYRISKALKNVFPTSRSITVAKVTLVMCTTQFSSAADIHADAGQPQYSTQPQAQSQTSSFATNRLHAPLSNHRAPRYPAAVLEIGQIKMAESRANHPQGLETVTDLFAAGNVKADDFLPKFKSKLYNEVLFDVKDVSAFVTWIGKTNDGASLHEAVSDGRHSLHEIIKPFNVDTSLEWSILNDSFHGKDTPCAAAAIDCSPVAISWHRYELWLLRGILSSFLETDVRKQIQCPPEQFFRRHASLATPSVPAKLAVDITGLSLKLCKTRRVYAASLVLASTDVSLQRGRSNGVFLLAGPVHTKSAWRQSSVGSDSEELLRATIQVPTSLVTNGLSVPKTKTSAANGDLLMIFRLGGIIGNLDPTFVQWMGDETWLDAARSASGPGPEGSSFRGYSAHSVDSVMKLTRQNLASSRGTNTPTPPDADATCHNEPLPAWVVGCWTQARTALVQVDVEPAILNLPLAEDAGTATMSSYNPAHTSNRAHGIAMMNSIMNPQDMFPTVLSVYAPRLEVRSSSTVPYIPHTRHIPVAIAGFSKGATLPWTIKLTDIYASCHMEPLHANHSARHVLLECQAINIDAVLIEDADKGSDTPLLSTRMHVNVGTTKCNVSRPAAVIVGDVLTRAGSIFPDNNPPPQAARTSGRRGQNKSSEYALLSRKIAPDHEDDARSVRSFPGSFATQSRFEHSTMQSNTVHSDDGKSQAGYSEAAGARERAPSDKVQRPASGPAWWTNVSFWVQCTAPKLELAFDDRFNANKPEGILVRAELEDVSASIDLQNQSVVRTKVNVGRAQMNHKLPSKRVPAPFLILHSEPSTHMNNLDGHGLLPSVHTRTQLGAGGCATVCVVTTLANTDGVSDSVSINIQSIDSVIWCPSINAITNVMCLDLLGGWLPYPKPATLSDVVRPSSWPAIDCKVGTVQMVIPFYATLDDAPGSDPDKGHEDVFLAKISCITVSPQPQDVSPVWEKVKRANDQTVREADWESVSHSSFTSEQFGDTSSANQVHVELSEVVLCTTRWDEVVRTEASPARYSLPQDNPALRWNAQAEQQRRSHLLSPVIVPLSVKVWICAPRQLGRSSAKRIRAVPPTHQPAPPQTMRIEVSVSRQMQVLIDDRQIVLLTHVVTNNLSKTIIPFLSYPQGPSNTTYDVFATMESCTAVIHESLHKSPGTAAVYTAPLKDAAPPRTSMPLMNVCLNKPIFSFVYTPTEMSVSFAVSGLSASSHTASIPLAASVEVLTPPSLYDHLALGIGGEDLAKAGSATSVALGASVQIGTHRLGVDFDLNCAARVNLHFALLSRLLQFGGGIAESIVATTPQHYHTSAAHYPTGTEDQESHNDISKAHSSGARTNNSNTASTNVMDESLLLPAKVPALQAKAKRLLVLNVRTEQIYVSLATADDHSRRVAVGLEVLIQRIVLSISEGDSSTETCLGLDKMGWIAQLDIAGAAATLFRRGKALPLNAPADVGLTMKMSNATRKVFAEQKIDQATSVTLCSPALIFSIGPYHILSLTELIDLITVHVIKPAASIKWTAPAAAVADSTSTGTHAIPTPAADVGELSSEWEGLKESFDDLSASDFGITSTVSPAQRPLKSELLLTTMPPMAAEKDSQPATSPPVQISWSYSKPRVVSRVTALPFPCDDSHGTGRQKQLRATLYHWDLFKQEYVAVLTFSLYQLRTETYSLPYQVSAREWKIVVGTSTPGGKLIRLHPGSLVGCLQVSSFQSKALSPIFKVAVDITKLCIKPIVCLHEGGDNAVVSSAQSKIGSKKHFCTLPTSAVFASIDVSNVDAQFSLSPDGASFGEFGCKLGLSTVDPYDLTLTTVLQPTDASIRVRIPSCYLEDSERRRSLQICSSLGLLDFTLRCSLLRSVIGVASSWAEILSQPSFTPAGAAGVQASLAAYSVLNNTQLVMQMRQRGTNEHVLLAPGSITGYAWRTKRGFGDHRVQLAAEGDRWSLAAVIDGEALTSLHEVFVGGVCAVVKLTVSHAAGGQRCITLEGSHIVENWLPWPVHVRLLQQLSATGPTAESLVILSETLLLPDTPVNEETGVLSTSRTSFALPCDATIVVQFRRADQMQQGSEENAAWSQMFALACSSAATATSVKLAKGHVSNTVWLGDFAFRLQLSSDPLLQTIASAQTRETSHGSHAPTSVPAPTAALQLRILRLAPLCMVKNHVPREIGLLLAASLTDTDGAHVPTRADNQPRVYLNLAPDETATPSGGFSAGALFALQVTMSRSVQTQPNAAAAHPLAVGVDAFNPAVSDPAVQFRFPRAMCTQPSSQRGTSAAAVGSNNAAAEDLPRKRVTEAAVTMPGSGLVVIVRTTIIAILETVFIDIFPLMTLRNTTPYTLWIKTYSEELPLCLLPGDVSPYGTDFHQSQLATGTVSACIGTNGAKASALSAGTRPSSGVGCTIGSAPPFAWSSAFSVKGIQSPPPSEIAPVIFVVQRPAADHTADQAHRGCQDIAFVARAKRTSQGCIALTFAPWTCLSSCLPDYVLLVKHVSKRGTPLDACANALSIAPAPPPGAFTATSDCEASSASMRDLTWIDPPEAYGNDRTLYLCFSVSSATNDMWGWSQPIDMVAAQGRTMIAVPNSHGQSLPLAVTVAHDGGVAHGIIARDQAPRLVVYNYTEAALSTMPPGGGAVAQILPRCGLHLSDAGSMDKAGTYDDEPALLYIKAMHVVSQVQTQEQARAHAHTHAQLPWVTIDTRRFGTQEIESPKGQRLWVRIMMKRCTREVFVHSSPPQQLGAQHSAQALPAVHSAPWEGWSANTLQMLSSVWFTMPEVAVLVVQEAHSKAAAETEVVLFTLSDLSCSYSLASETDPRLRDSTAASVEVCIGHIQLDNQAEDDALEFPVILSHGGGALNTQAAQHGGDSTAAHHPRKSSTQPMSNMQDTADKKDRPHLRCYARWCADPTSASARGACLRRVELEAAHTVGCIEDKLIFVAIQVVRELSAASTAVPSIVHWVYGVPCDDAHVGSADASSKTVVARHLLQQPRASGQSRLISHSYVHSPDPPPMAILTAAHAAPLYIHELQISEVPLQVSARASIKVFINVDDAFVQLDAVHLAGLFGSSAQIGAAVGNKYSHWQSKVGWALGSLGLLGNPTGLARSVGAGVRDLVVLPMQGLANGPTAFVEGVGTGASSFFKHISTGTLSSLSGFASSVSRNMDHLSMDDEHTRVRQSFRQPATWSSGVAGFGYSLLSAVAGVVDQPMQSLVSETPTTSGFLGGVGRGMLGVVTKPVGGWMDLVASTSDSILKNSGLVNSLHRRRPPRALQVGCNSLLKYRAKYVDGEEGQLTQLSGLRESRSGAKYACVVLLTSAYCYVVDDIQDAVQLPIPLAAISSVDVDGPEPDAVCNLTLTLPLALFL